MGTGPLEGVRVIELQGIGPGPFCGMMLSDMGAEVIRVDRSANVTDHHLDAPPIDVLARGRASIGLDLKNPDGAEALLRLVEHSDALIEGFRPGVMERIADVFKAKTRDEWCQIMDATDVCFAPVLTLAEAPQHPHNVHREVFCEVAGVIQPSPSPRFSRTVGAVQSPPAHPGQHTDEVLAIAGYDPDDIAKLRDTGAVA